MREGQMALNRGAHRQRHIFLGAPQMHETLLQRPHPHRREQTWDLKQGLWTRRR